MGPPAVHTKRYKQPSFNEWQDKFGNDKGSTLGNLPTDEELLTWARTKLGMPAAQQ